MQRPWGAVGEDEVDASKPTGDVADTGEVSSGNEQQPVLHPAPTLPGRPPLQRDAMQAVPPPVPAPDPPMTNTTIAVDPEPANSLSLLQLRRIVAEVHRTEPLAYDFEYADMGPHADEIDEWFGYQSWQWVRLSAAQRAFDWHWENENEADGRPRSWDDADNETRTRFVRAAIAGVQSNDAALRSASIGKLVYLILGRWGDTALSNATGEDSGRSVASLSQLQAIKAGVECVASLEGLPVVWDALRSSFELQWSGEAQQQASSQEAQDELMNLMTIMYICIQETLNDPDVTDTVHAKLLELNPSLIDFMMTATSKLRWDEQGIMPQTQIFLLFWKSILLVFGGGKELASVKEATSEVINDGKARQTITASPLDYHVFRQEVTSKYPAYVPPQPAIPLEPENTSLLPPIPNHTTRTSTANGILPNANAGDGGASILNQPVHIATPAPSPPPSPAAGGKGGKKQNYQTNQNFPFMYPPLDATSNSAGGKGLAGIHDALVSRKWEGSDIPASILEAGELFSSRVRMTRATRQLWEEREKFLKYDRGWSHEDEDDDIEDLDLNELTLEEREVIRELKAEDAKDRKKPPPPSDAEPDYGPCPEKLTDRDRRILRVVEDFYREALPHLQSLVIVLLRPILSNVTAIVQQQPQQQPQQQQQQQSMAGKGMGPGVNGGGPSQQRSQDGSVPGSQTEQPEQSLEDIDLVRTREITAKAMTAILLLLLKWLRLSHVLKFEYFTQLLLDSNYIPLVLKLFAHQDIQQVVDSKTDRVEHSFFYFCNQGSNLKEPAAEGEQDEEAQMEDEPVQDESEDDAAPPPIKRRRSPPHPPTAAASSLSPEEDSSAIIDEQAPNRPEVDEMGYPIGNVPEEPITDFSRRNFFSLINYLRVMQKICKNKAHRNLLLVQYKSSTIIRKSLKVPQPELRLYTLKLFKGQVPYCGRKWRQGNMRVITAVYLHCRPELRDEWLAGSDVDADVDSALPLEQALRGLTHWLNLRRYPEKLAPGIGSQLREEQDFFSRELERLDITWADAGADDGMSEMDHVEGWP